MKDYDPENILRSLDFHGKPGAPAIFGMVKRKEVGDA